MGCSTVTNGDIMETKEVIQFVLAFFGGGLVLAIINWLKEARSATHQREVAFLQDQLRLLYGPLHCVTAENQEILNLATKLSDALNPNIKAEQQIPPFRGAEATGIIGLSNAYSTRYKENNARIKELLQANSSLIDGEDVKPFVDFLADCARMQVEVDEKHADGLHRIHQILGAVNYVRPGFVEHVTAQWNAKRERRNELMLPRSWPWSRRLGGR
jgi:hypothetical protein